MHIIGNQSWKKDNKITLILNKDYRSLKSNHKYWAQSSRQTSSGCHGLSENKMTLVKAFTKTFTF